MSLEITVHPENIESMRPGNKYWASKTHCKRGHAYTKENTYWNPTSNGRQCKACLKLLRPTFKKMPKSYMATRQAEWRKRNPERVREIERQTNLKRFGLTISDYDKMLADQGGVCAICLKPPGKKRLAVDHCHDTGIVRALLCGNCNIGLGCFKHNPRLLNVAKNYLIESQYKTEKIYG